jgi:hypothetical protein
VYDLGRTWPQHVLSLNTSFELPRANHADGGKGGVGFHHIEDRCRKT